MATRLESKGVAIVVADNGCGMSSEFVKTLLFRPFHSTKTKGLGIGMFQCKKIIEAHGGSISVESEPGKRHRFTILLPLGTNPQPNQTIHHETESSDHRRRRGNPHADEVGGGGRL